MKIEEIDSKTDSELAYDLGQMRKQLFDLRFAAVAGSSANTAQIRVVRRSIARVHTVLHERANGIHGKASKQ